MKVYLSRDLKDRNVYWETENHNSFSIMALSGNGKSFLVNNIISIFKQKKYKIVIISDKAKVDYKDKETTRINPLEDHQELEDFIEETHALFKELKTEVENSEYSHIKHLKKKANLIIILDELWSIQKLEKEIRKKLVDLIELIIRQGRFLDLFLIMASQIGKVSETDIPIRQASIMVLGKTDTRELSESLIGDSSCYDTPLKQGMFFYWDRQNRPKIIRVVPEKISLIKRIMRWIK